ncbi:hypothetical protein AA313_de0201652 [Arthrobotrys entomopaga]|nr:hypothetical protein AA313_de0201652 [Arthrobotrys entomopaga]
MSLLTNPGNRTPLLSSVVYSHHSHPLNVRYSASPSLFSQRHPHPATTRLLPRLSHPDSPPGVPSDLPGSNNPTVIHRLQIALKVLEETSFGLSCVFLAELFVTLLAFGLRYLKRWMHAIDAAVIVLGFLVDVVLKNGVVEEVAGLVVVLRLWRLIKIAEECVVEAYQEAEEEMGQLKERVEQLEKENDELRAAQS